MGGFRGEPRGLHCPPPRPPSVQRVKSLPFHLPKDHYGNCHEVRVMKTSAIFVTIKKKKWINLGFWETDHLPLP